MKKAIETNDQNKIYFKTNQNYYCHYFSKYIRKIMFLFLFIFKGTKTCNCNVKTDIFGKFFAILDHSSEINETVIKQNCIFYKFKLTQIEFTKDMHKLKA